MPAVAPADDDGEDAEVDGEDDEVADGDEPLPLFALVRTNDSAPDRELALGVPDVADVEPLPDVPTAPLMWSACCRQPVTVIELALELERLVCELLGDGGVCELLLLDCAAAPVPNAIASAATPIQTLRVMPPPSCV